MKTLAMHTFQSRNQKQIRVSHRMLILGIVGFSFALYSRPVQSQSANVLNNILMQALKSGKIGKQQKQSKNPANTMRRMNPLHQGSPRQRPNPAGGNSARRNRKRQKLPLHEYPARIVLGDGRIVRGRISFRAPEKLKLSHTKNSIRYEKNIRIKDIKKIRIISWKAHFIKKNKEGLVHRFDPAKYHLLMKNGATLHPAAALPNFLKRFMLINENGKVFFFSFWMDLKRSNGSWYTGTEVGTGNITRRSHRGTVREIELNPQSSH